MNIQDYLSSIDENESTRFYTENVRVFFNCTTEQAELLIKQALKKKLIEKKIGLICPNDSRIIESFTSTKDIPIEIICEVCETEERNFAFKARQLARMEYYFVS